jgi:YlmC/YmxH family sporulation protein
MRLSRWQGKEIINVYDGARFGLVGEADLEVDEASGLIQGIVFPERGFFFGRGREVRIPWEAVRRFGSELVIVDWNPRSKDWVSARTMNAPEERREAVSDGRTLEAASWPPEGGTKRGFFLHRAEGAGKD